MLRFWTGLILLLFFCSLIPAEAMASTEPQIMGEAALLMDLQNGQVLYSKNADRHMYPASTTKILTAIIALEKGHLNDIVTVPREATTVGGSAIGLQAGERLTLHDLLYAMLLASANDAAVTIADHIAGSVPAFAALMNEKARQIGARESHFVNPDGMPDPNHYTTARDLALIARYAMQNDTFRQIVGSRYEKISRPDANKEKGQPQEFLWNHNKMLSSYAGTIGVKTGYTVAAGQCLVAAARRNGRELLAVVLDSQGTFIYRDAETLLDYGFNHFQAQKLIERGQKVATFPVLYGAGPVAAVTAAGFSYDFGANGKETVEKKIIPEKNIRAPLEPGQKIGQLVFLLQGRELGRVDLVAASAVSRNPVARWPVWLAAVALLLFVLRVRVFMRRRARVRSPRYE